MAETNYHWEPTPHTADLAIIISAAEKTGLFHAALDGLLGSLDIEKSPGSNIKITEWGLSINAHGIEEALVDFLNECIYLMEVEDLVSFEIRDLNSDDKTTDAVIHCRPVMACERSEIGHIKAATYSDLNVIENEGMFRARIIFDT